MSIHIEVAHPGPDLLGEAPQWHAGQRRLYWIDAFAPAIRRLDPQSGRVESFALPFDIGSFVFCADGSLMAGTRAGFQHLRLGGGSDASGDADADADAGASSNGNSSGSSSTGSAVKCELVADPLARDRRLMLNDGKCDARGRYWCASVHSDFIGRSAELFRLDADHTVTRMDGDFIIGNGIAFSPDHTRMYLADSRDETVWVYDFDLAQGRICGKRVFFSTRDIEGRVDGATCDRDGNYWCALVHGGAVACISPQGRMLERIAVPAKHPTMVAFGGPELDQLYVTSATRMLEPAERAAWPQAGALFRIDGLGARGLPEPLFGTAV